MSMSTSRLLTITPNFTIDHSLHVDHLVAGTVHRTAISYRQPGGKGVNVARVVRTLGYTVEIAGILGGNAGVFAEQWFKREGFAGHYVWGDGETRSSILIDEADGRTTVINEAGMSVSADVVHSLIDMLPPLRNQFAWVSISGSVPQGTSADHYAALIDALRPAKIAVDSSGDALRVYVDAKPDLLRINEHEAASILGQPVDTVDDAYHACRTLQENGISAVAISLGELGAVGCDHTGAWYATTPAVAVLSTVGAGDAMFGGMLAALLDNQSFDVALRQGVAAGAATCTVRDIGALPVATYQQLLTQVQLIQLPFDQ
jgi:1-phosphofructokinase family hexose kinase